MAFTIRGVEYYYANVATRWVLRTASCRSSPGWGQPANRCDNALDLQPLCRHGHLGAKGHAAPAWEVELVGSDRCRSRPPARAAG
jgi:hypothetical protein